MLVMAVFVFLFLRPGPALPGDDTPGPNFFSQFNPFTPKPPAVTPPVDIPDNVPPPGTETPAAKLIKVSSMPVAGFGLFSKERLKDVPIVVLEAEGSAAGASKVGTGTKKPAPPLTEFMPAVRYVAKATGNIFQTFADKILERKFSGTTIPKVHEAYFGNRGESVAMRYLKSDDRTIETFVGIIPKELLGADTSGNNEVKGTFLPNNVKDISVSPDGLKIFYLFMSTNNSEESMIGTVLNLRDNRKVQIFDSSFTEWLPWWPNSNTITLSTKPSANIPGYMYTIDAGGKNLSKILGNINGLTTLAAPNGKLILYGDSLLSISLYHTDTRNSNALGLKTLPEKCVWGRGSDVIYCAVPKSVDFSKAYPDSWYQGDVSFNDELWKIDVKTGNTTLLANPPTIAGGEEIDAIKLAADEGENHLFFVNKKDSFLWKLDLK